MYKGIGKRVISMILCLAMILALLPELAISAKAETVRVASGKTVDPSTLEGWMQYFGENAITTEYIGGIWTDKSVFADLSDYLTADGITTLMGPDAAVTAEVRQMLETDPENFLVALSAIAANQQITGYTTKPTDTMFVLDVSESMDSQGYVPGMISAANAAIDTLMKGNEHNRVGVVLFCGDQYQGQSQSADTTIVLLPLDHYTSNSGAYLKYTGSRNSTTVYVADQVKRSDGTIVSNNSGKTTIGATYTQNGLYKAWGEFNKLSAADTVIAEGLPQAGTKRIPAVVLMSDGQPTVGDTTYYDVGTSSIGNGGDPSATNANRMTFLTQLTAAWVKAKLAEKYGIANSEVQFYTVGLNTATNSYATDVLNPAASGNNTVANLWNNFVSATPNARGQVTLGSGMNSWTTYKSTDGMITSVNQRVYPTAYFSASNTDGLATAFGKIAETLTRKTPYVTLVEEGNVGSTDGYVTIEDQLGVLMDVKSVKGLVLGNRIFTGAELAKSFAEGDFGTTDDPTAYGEELVRTVQERLNIADVAVAQDLLRAAWNAGQLAYTDATNYSNYIGWYEGENGEFLGHWQASEGMTGEGVEGNPIYINKSYGYLGTEDVGDYLTDMMHVVVTVRTKISTGDQAVIYKIPASLLPTVEYHVTLSGTDATQPETLRRVGAEPLRLLVEVGLRSDINSVNLEAKTEAYVANGGHVHKNSDGTYTFYTNRWGDGDGGEVNYDLPLTHLVTEAHFHPALDNVRYYFVEDTLVYSSRNGTVYNGASAPGSSGYYYARNYYEQQGSEAKYITEYVELEAETAAKAVKGNGGWYIPAGTPQQLNRFAAVKMVNATGTLNYSWNPVILHDNNGYHSYAFLGNNGKFTLAPAQGIVLSKTVAEKAEGAPEVFTFTINLSQEAPALQVSDAEGNRLTGIADINGTQITVTLTDGQRVYLTGIPTGTDYTVTEAVSDYYTASATNATGTVARYEIKAVDFVNTPKGYGSLIVGKEVTYPDGFVPGSAHNDRSFTVEVTFTGDTSGMIVPAGAQQKAENTYEITLKDAQSVTFGNIPEGVSYSVAETDIPAGYSLTEVRYSDARQTVHAKDEDTVSLINAYAPAAVSPNLKIRGTKTVENGSWPANAAFTVRLWQVNDLGSGEIVKTNRTATVTAENPNYTIDISDIVFEKTGTYYIRIAEDIPEDTDRIADMAYDRTMGLISITVTDEDADGKLEIQDTAVAGYQGTLVEGDAINGFTVTKDFTNVVTKDLVYIDVEKRLEGYRGNNPPLADITFGLFEDRNTDTPTYYGLTDGQGKVTLLVPVTASGIGSGVTYYLREVAPAIPNRIVGMRYDESWLYAIRITWDAENYAAVVEYATIDENGEVGQYALYDRQSVEFIHTNQFTPGVESTPAIKLSGEKTMTGDTAELNGRTFTFSVYETDATFKITGEPVQTVSNRGSSITFQPITYQSVGMKYMVIKEDATDRNGITVDTTEYHVSVMIEKYDQNGVTKLRVADGYPVIVKFGTTEIVAEDTLDFNNRYTLSGSVSTTLEGVKILSGRTLHAGEFTFELYKDDTLVESVTNRANGSFRFSTLAYGVQDLGIHTYTVVEKQPEGAENNKYKGVTYSTKVYTIEITVSDNGEGGLRLVKTVDGTENGEISFRNSYEASSTTARIRGTKTWYNVDTQQNIPLSGDEFTFQLYRSNETFSSQGSLVKSVENGEAGKISLNLTYSEPGDHYYILREAVGGEETVGYDTSRYFIRVLVSDDGEGSLSNTVTVTKEGEASGEITFGNRYTPAPATATIQGNKNLTGRDMVEGEFTFVLLDENEQELATAENVGNTFTFADIAFENTGVFTYKVIERIPQNHENWTYKGVAYDRIIHTVTVTVTDENGVLKTEVSYPTGGLVFNNTYEGADTYFELSGEKHYNKPLHAGQFAFELVDKNGVHIATATNDENGIFTFTQIPLAEVGEYTFFVREKQPEGAQNNKLGGTTYDTTEYKVTLTVTDPGDGLLAASVPVVENGPIVFTNIYAVEPTQAVIRGTKILEGRALAEGEFTFTLTGDGVELQAVNKADGMVEFQPITYTEAGEYTYTFTEVTGTLGGITYDATQHTVFVDVIDNGDGTLYADVVYPNGSPVFTNIYTVTGTAEFAVEGVKVLEGRNMTDQDVFTFQLKDEAGQTLATADAVNGRFAFEALTLDSLGTHTFTVSEMIPQDAVNGVKDRITYSAEVYTLEVTVRDDGQGGMVADIPVIRTEGVAVTQMVFTNVYTPEELSFALEIQKRVKVNSGSGVSPEGFVFEVLQNGQVVQTLTSDAAGKASLPMTATEAQIGQTYEFTVVERNTGVRGVTYSTVEYAVAIAVGQNADGTLALDLTVNGESVEALKLEFVNTYDRSVTPNTGDAFSISLFVGLMAVSATCMVILLMAKKKEEMTQQ